MGDKLVYLLQRGYEFKIGHTQNLKQRLAMLSTGSAVNLKVVHTIRTAHNAELENLLKARFAANRLNREWFALNDAAVRYICSIREWPTEGLTILPILTLDRFKNGHRKGIVQQHELSFPEAVEIATVAVVGMATDTAEHMTLQELLKAKAGIQSSTELREKIGGSSAQISNLWHGRDTIGARLMLRILTAFPQISAEELSHVKEAEKALTPPKQPCRRRLPKRHDASC